MPNLSFIAAGAVALASALQAQGPVDLDTVRAGRFDAGKMWTFEYAPSQYFTETYGFDANDAWFERARLSAVRVPGCSASFVSPDGLLATNHHCIRGRLASISRDGETLLDDGFVARSIEDERRIPGYYVDQLIAVSDVTAEVFAGIYWQAFRLWQKRAPFYPHPRHRRPGLEGTDRS